MCLTGCVHPKRVLATLWTLGTDNALCETARQRVSHKKAILGRKSEKPKAGNPLLRWRASTWGVGVPACAPAIQPPSLSPGVEALLSPSQRRPPSSRK